MRRMRKWGADVALRVLMSLLLSAPPLVGCLSVGSAPTRWPVDIKVEGVRHTVQVPENTPVLAVVESAGLMPSSDCRRGNCLSCVAVRRARRPAAIHSYASAINPNRACAPRLPSIPIVPAPPAPLARRRAGSAGGCAFLAASLGAHGALQAGQGRQHGPAMQHLCHRTRRRLGA